MASTLEIATLLQQIEAKGKALEIDRGNSRIELLAAARSLCYKLETPIEALLRICWAEVSFGPKLLHSRYFECS